MTTRQKRIAEVDWRLVTASERLRIYRARGDVRSVYVQSAVVDRLLDERLEAMYS